ncbi:MAG: hypothetical protein J0H57_00790, partial [Rhodospirillales bacterium]|nr:hypothetical protein [Rhodospirillales bacterium]
MLGAYACYSLAWSPYSRGMIIRATLEVSGEAGGGLEVRYLEQVLGGAICFTGELHGVGRTMGGLLILFALTISTLLWVDLKNGYVWAVLFVTLGYGALGFADDYLKVTKLNTRGVPGRVKLIVQAAVGLIAAIWITWLARGPLGTALTFPVFKEFALQLGWFFPIFGMLVMMGASNAVNLTDGLDGLAIVPTMITAAVFTLIAYLVGNRIFADYLQLNAVAGVGELAVFCSALIG